MTYTVRDGYGDPHNTFSIKEAKYFYCYGRHCIDCLLAKNNDSLENIPCFRLSNEEILNRLGDEIIAVPDEEISESNDPVNDTKGTTNNVQLSDNDPVNHPSHYTAGGIECIDAIEAALTCQTNPTHAWYTGQIFKYLWRWPMKNSLEDLKKALFYLNKLIEKVERKDN